MTPQHTDGAGVKLIQEFEGLRLTAYRDGGGVLTIGYGHTGPDVRPGMRITPQQALALFYKDLAEAEADVNRLVKAATPNQFAALVAFTFNLGGKELKTSTLLRLHNAGRYEQAAEQFGRWVHDDGKVVPGLVRRRAAEKALYLA